MLVQRLHFLAKKHKRIAEFHQTVTEKYIILRIFQKIKDFTNFTKNIEFSKIVHYSVFFLYKSVQNFAKHYQIFTKNTKDIYIYNNQYLYNLSIAKIF